jgi:ribonucleoside-diphosphate reductase alpha chain
MTNLSQDAIKLLKDKQYFKETENDWNDLSWRIAQAIGGAEETPQKQEEVTNQVYEAMSDLEFIFSTPVLLNADKDNPGQLSSCFITETKDSIDEICKTDAEFAKIFQKNGGAGTDLSVLRPAKSNVNSSRGYAGGVLTFMEKFDATADQMTKFNPSRKGALKCNLQVWHPQIFEFIHCKDDLSKLNRMNISVSLSDKFMQAVEEDKNWDLKFPDFDQCKEIYNLEWDGDIDQWEENNRPVKIYQTIKARQLLREIAESSWKTGEPGVNFSGKMNRDNPNPHLSKKVYTNPCSEFSNIPYSSCNLGSVNLLTCTKGSIFDWDKLYKLSYKAIRWFDNMITINQLPLEKISQVTKAIRPVGMGFMALSDVMYDLGIKYNSKEGLAFADKIAQTMKGAAIQASMDLARERGSYPAWEGSEWQKQGISIRNSSLLSIAPNGTIAFLANVNGGCEPNFGLCYNRRTYEGTIYYVVNSIFKKQLEDLGLYSEELMEKISKNHGSCKGIKEVPVELQEIFVTTSDMTPEEHVDMVATLQSHVDLSISKTVNFSNNATVKDIYNIYLYAWKKQLKGMTVFRDGCREFQTLSTASSYEKKEEMLKFDYIIPPSKDDLGETYGTNIKKKVACGSLYINLCRDKEGNLVESFVVTGKGGICQSNINAISRLISLALRSGIKVETIIDQLQNIKCPACTILRAQGKDIGLSCPDVIAKYIKEKYEQGNIVIKEQKTKSNKSQSKPIVDKMVCKSCGKTMRAESGCLVCECGNSMCG